MSADKILKKYWKTYWKPQNGIAIILHVNSIIEIYVTAQTSDIDVTRSSKSAMHVSKGLFMQKINTLTKYIKHYKNQPNQIFTAVVSVDFPGLNDP